MSFGLGMPLEDKLKTLTDRFRNWYDHERDCNGKIIAMLNSVPGEKRQSPEFERACDLAAHLVMARRMWLHRLGQLPAPPAGWDKEGTILTELPGMFTDIEKAWVEYLNKVDDQEIARELVWKSWDGQYRSWPIELILTQVSGHAWYHRGQIVELVRLLGGETTSTDYIFWNRPLIVEAPKP